jgi:phage terminase large subunit-like protein
MAAASFEQADTVFGSAKTMITEGPLAPLFDCFETEIMPKRGPGRLYRVAAKAGTNDGRRPTFFVGDELHEWEGNKERVHLILSNGRSKRQNSWELNISTAGWDLTSLLGRLYRHGVRVQDGEEKDDRFLFRWIQAGANWDLDNYEQRCKAIREANPAADHFLDVEKVAARYEEIPLYEWQRYYLNQWTEAPEQWEVALIWETCENKTRAVSDETRIMIGFDGSYAGDSTAIVGVTIEPIPHLFVIGAWEKAPSSDPNWRVAIPDVEQTIRDACIRWNVEAVACDPHRWQRSIAVLAEEGLPMVEWPSHSPSRMVPACAGFADAVRDKQLTHDGDSRMAKHMANCQLKIDSRGPRITKDHQKSERHIDLAVAGVIAHDMVSRVVEDSGPLHSYIDSESAVM